MQSEITELNQLVKRLAETQAAVKENDKRFVARFRGQSNEFLLGSDRTWQRLKECDWENLTPAKWLGRVRTCVAILDGGSEVIEPIVTMPFYKQAKEQVERVERSVNDRRIAVILAPTGTGKTTFAKAMVRAEPKTRRYVMCSPGWKEKSKAAAGSGNAFSVAAGIYHELSGLTIGHASLDEAVTKLADWLKANKVTVFLDQAERGGIALMTLLIHLVDVAPSCFVYLAYPTHYDRMIKATEGALAEAKQFLGRCIKPVMSDYATGTKIGDLRCLLKHEGINVPEKDAQQLLVKIVSTGGFRTLTDALASARASADENNSEVDADVLIDALDTVLGYKLKDKSEPTPLKEAA